MTQLSFYISIWYLLAYIITHHRLHMQSYPLHIYAIFFFPVLSLPLSSRCCCSTIFAAISRYSPPNTNPTLTHCHISRKCPNLCTLSSIVKNFRVVVIVVHVNGEKWWIVRKMNTCPNDAEKLSWNNNRDLSPPLESRMAIPRSNWPA